METKKPHILLFKSINNTYFYDVNRNKIIRIPKEGFEYLKSIGNKNISDEPQVISLLREQGFLKGEEIKEIKHPQLGKLEGYLANQVSHVTLQLTQNCNFRCSYCVYSENNNSKQRAHSSKRMSLKLGMKCIDFISEHSADSKEIYLGFYGGEPLLEFKLIKSLMTYAEEKFLGKSLRYNITTNGSLFTDEIIELFLEKKVDVTVSLDGPKEVHDMNRRFAKDGSGTFDTIYANLMHIQNKYPEFLKQISFNVVIDPENSFEYINSVFAQLKEMGVSQIHSTIIDDTYSDEKITYTEEYESERDYEIFKAYLYYLGRLEEKDVSLIALEELSNKLDLQKKMKITKDVYETYSHAGPCIPGRTRLLITVDGDLYPCERVSESSEVMKIGNITQGFDIEKAKSLMDVGKLTAEQCKKCFAIHNCYLCAKYADNLTELNGDLLNYYCREVKEKVKYDFLDLIMLREIEEIEKGRMSDDR